MRAQLPDTDVVYLADQANVPYGERSEEELVRLLAANVATLEAAGAEAIVMGCNTSCAIASKRGWPPARIPILDLIDAAAEAVAASGATRVGVVATTATARAGAYGAAIRRRVPHADVREVAAPRLVPLVEAGMLAGAEAREAVARACAPLGGDIEALVYACTHYPLLDPVFAEVVGGHAVRIDPAIAQAARAAALVRTRAAASENSAGAHELGRTRYLTTGALAPFRAALEMLVGPLGERDEVVALTVAPR